MTRAILVTSKYSPVDKYAMLWACCVIDHYKDNRRMLAPKFMRQELGEDAQLLFNDACEMADKYLIDDYSRELTEKGKYVVANWQAIADRLLSF